MREYTQEELSTVKPLIDAIKRLSPEKMPEVVRIIAQVLEEVEK